MGPYLTIRPQRIRLKSEDQHMRDCDVTSRMYLLFAVCFYFLVSFLFLVYIRSIGRLVLFIWGLSRSKYDIREIIRHRLYDVEGI